MKKTMAVYDPDPFYAERLSDYVNRKEKGMFQAAAFTSKEKLGEYAKENGIDILLTGCGNKDEEFSGLPIGQILRLSEERLGSDEKEIYKYQSGDDIIREVMACYGEMPGAELAAAGMGRRRKTGEKQIIGIYSPVGRCGKTSLALAIGQTLAREERVLFASLDVFTGLSTLLGERWKRDLSDLIYYYKQGRFNPIRLNAVTCFIGDMAYLPPLKYPEDSCQISTEEMAGLFLQIMEESDFSTLILDVGCSGKPLIPLLEICGVIYMPVKEDIFSLAKVEEFERYLGDSEKPDLSERIKKVHVPIVTGTKRMEHFPQELLWGDLGDYVRGMFKGQKGLWEN